MASINTSHLAGEFLVAGELSRRGYPVSITMGRAKEVDIYAETRECDEKREKKTIKVDAKAARTRSWVIGKVNEAVYYVFVYLGNKNELSKNRPPEYFIVCGKETPNLIKQYRGGMKDILYKTLADGDYKDRWDKLPLPPP